MDKICYNDSVFFYFFILDFLTVFSHIQMRMKIIVYVPKKYDNFKMVFL